MAGGANAKGDHNPSSTTTPSTSLQHFRVAGNTCSSNDPVGRGSDVGHCSGTVNSFNKQGNGPPNFIDAKINSGKNSGASNQNHHQASNSGAESTRLKNHCSGTHSSFNCYGKGSQKFAGAIINSGQNSGNRGGPSSGPAGASEQQPRVTGTRDSFNNYGSTQLPNRLNCFGNRRLFENNQSKSQDFSGARINSGENSGDS